MDLDSCLLPCWHPHSKPSKKNRGPDLRISEALELQPHDVDFKNSTAPVRV